MPQVMLGARFETALLYAKEAHQEQLRKGTSIPYFAHCLAVTAVVLEHGGNEDEAIAALLHDVAEDQGGVERLREISERFGATVASIVAGCSDTLDTPKPPWRERKERYIEDISTATAAMRLVSLADKLHNARATLTDYTEIGEDLWARFNTGKEGLMWYYPALTRAFQQVGDHPELTREFAAVVEQLVQLVEANGA